MPIRIWIIASLISWVGVVGVVGRADEPAVRVDAAEVRGAIDRALPLLKQAARNYPTHRKCFACHHQTFPLLALRASAAHGFERDAEVERLVVDFTRASFERQKAKLLEGGQVGGAGLTVSYGLWTLAIADERADELSAAMTSNLLKLQNEDGYWKLQAIRPPMEESTIFCAALAVYGLKRYAPAEQQDAAKKSVERAMQWLEKQPVESHEDAVGRLLARVWSGADAMSIRESIDAVKKARRDDGGWAQTASMQPDAYATGQTLWALHEAGESVQDETWQRGAAWLLRAQEKDGSWHVVTRAKPVQAYFDNWDPHGKDQFISTTATGWAVAALALATAKTSDQPTK